MLVTARIPSALASYTGGQTRIEVEAESVAALLQVLERQYAALVPLLHDETGALRPRVNIYVNDEHVRYREGLDTSLQDGDLVYITPIIVGG